MTEEKYTFEKVWQTLNEISQIQKKSAEDAEIRKIEADKEAERRKAEADKEAEKRNAEWEAQRKKDATDFEKWKTEREEERKKSAAEAEKRNAEWDKKMKELREEIGGIGRSNGAVAEETIYNSLENNMTFAGINFHDIDRNWNRKKTALKLHTEVDIVLVNDDTLALIETKYKVRDKDVTKLVETIQKKFRILYPQYSGYKLILGIGGMSFEKQAIDEAEKNGVGIIKVVGDKVEYNTDGIRVY